MPEEWLESDDEESTDWESPADGQSGEAGGQVAGGLVAGAAGVLMAAQQGLLWSR